MSKYAHLLNTMQYKEALAHAEKETFINAYKYTGFNQSATAKLMGVSRGTAIYKLKEWGIDRKTILKSYI